MNILEELEAKMKNVEEQINQHSTKSKEISENMEKLAADRANSHSFIHALNGALQAYQDVAKILKSESAPELAGEALEAVSEIIS